jgi:hypothetical protein
MASFRKIFSRNISSFNVLCSGLISFLKRQKDLRKTSSKMPFLAPHFNSSLAAKASPYA